MSRGRTLLLALVLLAAGLWLIFAESGTGSGTLDVGEDAAESEAPAHLLSSATAEGDAASPGLAGRGADADAEAATRRGLVRVRVVGLDGDTQRLDLLVDHVGRRTLRRVEPGRVTLRATWSRRRASREIDVVEGGETTIRLELPPPARRR